MKLSIAAALLSCILATQGLSAATESLRGAHVTVKEEGYLGACDPTTKVPSDIACPAMRFLTRFGVENGRFRTCGKFDGKFLVDAYNLRKLVREADDLGFNFINIEDQVTVYARAFEQAIVSQQTVDTHLIDMQGLQNHFDHGASTGIIGSATRSSSDNDSFNQGKYDEVLALLQDGDASKTRFTETDIGRVVNAFGSNAYHSTMVGHFSWAVLSFEYSNLFSAFKEFDDAGNPYLSLENFEKLYKDGGTTGLTWSKDRSAPWSLQDTICKMEIRITDDVIAQMTEEEDANFYDLFTTLCGEGFERCKAGYTGGCNLDGVVKEEGKTITSVE